VSIKVNKKSTGIVAILLGVILSVIFIFNLTTVNNEINTKSVGDIMMSAATEMTEIKSVSGTSVDEAYYQEHGNYLRGESKMHNANTRIAIANATTTSLVGLTLSLTLAVYGLSTLRTMKADE